MLKCKHINEVTGLACGVEAKYYRGGAVYCEAHSSYGSRYLLTRVDDTGVPAKDELGFIQQSVADLKERVAELEHRNNEFIDGISKLISQS